MHNVTTVRVTKTDILQAPDDPAHRRRPSRRAGSPGSGAAAAYLINHNADNTLATFRFRLKDVKMFAAEDALQGRRPQLQRRLVHYQKRGQSRRSARAPGGRRIGGSGSRPSRRPRFPRWPCTSWPRRASRWCTPGPAPRTKAGTAWHSTSCRFPTTTSPTRS